MTAGQRGEDERKVALSLREREQPGLRCMAHTFPVISLCSQWLWLVLQAALELKNSTNTGARTSAATSCVWPSRVRCSALGIAFASAVAVTCINGKLAEPSMTTVGTATRAAFSLGTEASSPMMAAS